MTGPLTEVAGLLWPLLERHGALAQTMVLGLSGGVDSTALALALARPRWQGRTAGRLLLAHVDHGAHALSSAAAEHVARLAARLGLPLATRALGLGPRSEAVLREARYQALLAIATAAGARLVLTAHHQDDQIETVLFRMARGCGPRGLSGIPERRPLGPGVDVLRPLLGVRRAALAAVVGEAGETPFEDPTNADLRFARNRIRRVLLPALRERHGDAVDAALLSLASAARRVRARLDLEAERLLAAAARPAPWRLELGRDSLARVPRAIAAEALRRAMEQIAQRPVPWPAVVRALALLDAPCGKRAHGKGLPLVERTAGGLLLVALTRVGLPPAQRMPVPVAPAVPFGGTEWVVQAPGASGPCFARTRRPGDRIAERGKAVSLAEWLVARQVPRFDRDRLPVLVDAQDRVLAVGGPISA